MLDYFLSSLDTAIFLALLVLVIGNIHSLVANIQTKSSDKKVVVLTSVMLVILIAYFILFKYFPSGYPGYYCDTRMNDMQQLRSAQLRRKQRNRLAQRKLENRRRKPPRRKQRKRAKE
jgi:hypothetical protein